MANITLDVAYDESDFAEFLEEIKSEYTLELTIVNENGPAGGWPEIKFEGNRENIERFMRDHYSCGDKESDDELIATISE